MAEKLPGSSVSAIAGDIGSNLRVSRHLPGHILQGISGTLAQPILCQGEVGSGIAPLMP